MTEFDSNDVPSREKLMRTVLDLVAKTVGDKRIRIKPDTALFSSLDLFDSFALLELVLRLEKTFGLSIPDEDLDLDTFSSPRTIVTYLFGRLETDKLSVKPSTSKVSLREEEAH